MWHAWDRTEKCTLFWWKIARERDHSEDRDVDGIRVDVRETDCGWNGISWFRTGTGGGLL
jgi:hypothetical protein